jgi:hypothetical protein
LGQFASEFRRLLKRNNIRAKGYAVYEDSLASQKWVFVHVDSWNAGVGGKFTLFGVRPIQCTYFTCSAGYKAVFELKRRARGFIHLPYGDVSRSDAVKQLVGHSWHSVS